LKKKENINTENFGEISEDFKNEKIFFLFGFQNFRLGKKNFESHLFQYPFSKCSVAKFPCLKLKMLTTQICKTQLQKTKIYAIFFFKIFNLKHVNFTTEIFEN